MALFVGLLISLPAWAQTTTSSIVGRVADVDGPLQDALVTAVYTPSGITYHALTNANGMYRINGVVAGGPYTIKAEMQGHRAAERLNVSAPLGDKVEVDFELPVSATTLDVVVISDDAANSGMDVQNSGVATHIDNRALMAVPTVSRSLNDIMRLTPQGTASGTGFTVRLTPQGVSTANGFMVGGGNFRSSVVTVDGASFNNAFGIGSSLPAGGSPLSLDAIDQLSVSITPFDVRHSGFQGGAINMVTKQGGNEWHGSVYDYYTSSGLSGRRLGNVELSQASALNNVTGFTLGGPIVKDKLFFFLNAEYTPERVQGATAQARQDENSEWGGNGYNRPTVGRMDSIRNYLINEYGYDPGAYENYSVDASDYKLLARLDWIINLSNYALMFQSARYTKNQDFSSVAAELDSRLFGGRGNNVLRFTMSYQNEPRGHYGKDFPTVDILEPYTNSDGVRKYAVYTTFGLDPFTYQTANRVRTINVTDELTYSTGIHTLLGGVQLEHSNIRNVYMAGGGGWYVFDSWDSFVNKRDPVLFMVSFASGADPMALPEYVFNYIQPSLYAQDEMEFGRYFKLTAGLRLEMPMIRFANDNYHAGFARVVEENPGSTFDGKNPGDMPGVQVNVSPRVGFNWDVAQNRKLIVRGGTGLFTGRIPNVWLVNAISTSNVMTISYVANTKIPNAVVPFSPNRSEIVGSVAEGQESALPQKAVILAKDLRMPTSWKSSLAVDAKLPWGVKGTLEGIYSYNYNEVVATTLGYVEEEPVQLPGEPTGRVSYEQEGVGNGMSGFYLHNNGKLHGRYVSLTAQLEKRFDFGLNLTAAYTYSSALAVHDGGGDGANTLTQVSNVDGDNCPELGYTAFVSPHRVIATVDYTIYEGRRTATRVGMMYEGYHVGMVNDVAYSGLSYLMNGVGGISASRLVYVPTDEELDGMPFVTDENREAYRQYIANDRYLSHHRGEYSKRGAMLAPWHNRLDMKVCQEIYFDVKGRRTTLELGVDLVNATNLLNSNWGTYKQISSQTILEYANGKYSFKEPKWNVYNNLLSAWQLLLHVRYSF